ncbi:MAG: hypothetical protein J6A75_02085 [Lachnospiraceae bacterium]|nr:hypothetical protein [Lachnospiraceae bacterium]
MEQEQCEFTPTTFDIETQSRSIQILKTIIPYIDSTKQKNFALIVKFLELKNVASIFNGSSVSLSMCSSEDPAEMKFQLLNDIKKFCTPTEQDSIDMMLTAFQMFSSYDFLMHTPTTE